MIDKYPLYWMSDECCRNNRWWWAKRRMPRSDGFIYPDQQKEGTEVVYVDNNPFLAELDIVGFGGTNRESFCYLMDRTKEIVYPTFSGFTTNLENVKRIRNGTIKGIWVVKKKSAYYGIELID